MRRKFHRVFIPHRTHHRSRCPGQNANSDGGLGTSDRSRLLSGSGTPVDSQTCRRTVTLRLVREGGVGGTFERLASYLLHLESIFGCLAFPNLKRYQSPDLEAHDEGQERM